MQETGNSFRRRISKRIEFLAVYLLVQFFRVIPFFLIYWISFCAYILAFYIWGYRKRVVFSNLKNSFPEKSSEEIQKTAKQFYRNFCDVLAETARGLSMSERSLLKRFRVVNPELLNKLFKQNKSVISIGAHYANSEWGKILGKQLKHPMIIIYSPFMNKFLDRYNNRKRMSYGMNLIPLAKTLRTFNELRSEPHCFIMGVDQRPFDLKSALWFSFLNQETPFHKGYETIARKFNIPVVYSDIQRVRRGYYTIEYIMLCEEPSTVKEGFVVDCFVKTLEKTIRKKPEDWLWSHKRWKYKRNSA
ncbi:MAG: lysophospholipid acyltransferase family protein [bacterium]